jgi:hypothetical protein
LRIDADAVLAFAVAFQGLETIAGQVQIEQRRRRVELVKPHFRFAFKTQERLDPVSLGKLTCSLVPEADDHERILGVMMRYVKHNFGVKYL